MIKPYIIIPNLIVQPTWGGKYISEYKNLIDESVSSQNIGQSYELYEHTMLSGKTNTIDQPVFEISNPSNPQNTKVTTNIESISIKSLISENPVNILGEKSISVHGNKMGVLIKFTQAKGNSYQLHVKGDTNEWKTKPESWYFLEPGLVTLGIKEGIDWESYKNTCLKINDYATKLSVSVKNKKMTVESARHKLEELIEKLNPEQFVNLMELKINQGVDLSSCGVHHSWEESAKYSRGNIVYEVQKNVYDPVSTIRSFDKGKIKDDGSIRELQIEEYFKHIDREKRSNDPSSHIISPIPIEKGDNFSVSNIYKNINYSMDEIRFDNSLSNHHTETTDSFHHLFVKEGQVEIVSDKGKVIISKGYSAFIPASTGKYSLSAKHKAVILKTYV